MWCLFGEIMKTYGETSAIFGDELMTGYIVGYLKPNDTKGMIEIKSGFAPRYKIGSDFTFKPIVKNGRKMLAVVVTHQALHLIRSA